MAKETKKANRTKAAPTSPKTPRFEVVKVPPPKVSAVFFCGMPSLEGILTVHQFRAKRKTKTASTG